MKRNRLNIDYLNRYNNGESIWDIVKTENITYKEAFEGIFDRRFEARLLPQEEKDKICNDYLNGMSTVQLGKRYGISHKPMAVVLEENNIDRNSALSTRKYELNENYFDVIDTPNKAYVLGLLYSDGNNSKQKGTIRIQLQEDDKDILEKVRKELNYSKELTYVDCSKRIYGNGYVSKNMYSLDVYSKYMCNRLEEIGVVPNKSLILTFPECIPSDYVSHFIRGYMDGDGWISKKGGYSISLTSTESFCKTVQSIVKKAIKVDGKIVDASCHNGVTKVYRIDRKDETKCFLDYIYKDADIYLQRKYNIYLSRYLTN